MVKNKNWKPLSEARLTKMGPTSTYKRWMKMLQYEIDLVATANSVKKELPKVRAENAKMRAYLLKKQEEGEIKRKAIKWDKL